MRHAIRPVYLAAVLVLPGCAAWLLGVDDSAPAAPSAPDTGAVLAADAGPTVVPVDPQGACEAGRKKCGAQCVFYSDPNFGCSNADCAPCSYANAGAKCGAKGQCALESCDITHKNCDTRSDNGCESASASDPANCGVCGKACAGGEVCSFGTCSLNCAGALTKCGSACVDITRDLAHCGACDNAACIAPATGTGTVACEASACKTTCANGYRLAADNRSCELIAVACVAPSMMAGGVCGTWRAVASGSTARLLGGWSASPTAAWAVGDLIDQTGSARNGRVLRGDGAAWSSVLMPTESLFAVWGSSSTDVWVTGDSKKVWRWDGTMWNSVAPPSGGLVGFTDIWGSSASDIWFTVGASSIVGGYIMHWDGSAWTKVFPVDKAGELTGVWANSASNAWAVGTSGTILRWNGTIWSASPSTSREQLNDVGGSSASDVWAVGDSGTILRWSGTAWSTSRSGTGQVLSSVWSASPSNAWVVGTGGTMLHWDGTAWSAIPSGTTADLLTVWGSSAADVWAAGANGTMLHFSP